jgi:transposase
VIGVLVKTVKGRIKLRPPFKPLLTVSGIGEILGLTIMLETGEIGRFANVGNYASYCRCVCVRRTTGVTLQFEVFRF